MRTFAKNFLPGVLFVTGVIVTITGCNGPGHGTELAAGILIIAFAGVVRVLSAILGCLLRIESQLAAVSGDLRMLRKSTDTAHLFPDYRGASDSISSEEIAESLTDQSPE
ncbi:MAG: hypothetical protein KDA96_10215 [Planctomycetaceae bacterium]|nr:hypothetical protein [Planctomycetaceae bacterium]